MKPESAHTERLASLRAAVRALESPAGRGEGAVLAFGIAAVDARLADGGVAIAALHEAAAAQGGLPDEAAATLFLASLAARRAGPVLWALARHDLFAPGLACAGLTPDRILYAECGRDEEVLAAMEEGLRHGGLAAVVGEARRVPMAATRRLQLAAEEGGTPALLLRRRRKAAEDPLAAPSAAVTRWRIGAVPSSPLPAAGIGRARWHVALARQRGGEPHDWILEAPDAEARLALPAGAQHRAGAQRKAA